MPGKFSAIIMAGGSGTRFWPRSRRTEPKQTLSFLDGESLLQRTVKRLKQVIDTDDILIITGKDQLEITKSQVPAIPDENIIGEPEGRNTAPCVGLGAAILHKKAPDKPMIVVAADHYIEDEIEWLNVFSAGANATRGNDKIVVFGVVPECAHTGYGYVQYGKDAGSFEENVLYKVDCFKEKPDIETAKKYVDSKSFYWNSGCFAWMPETVLNLIHKHMPELETIIDKIMDSQDFNSGLAKYYGDAPNTSVDYGILEHAENIYGMKLDCGWNDVGSWASLFNVMATDENKNIVHGNELIIKDCKNSVLWSEDLLLGAVGLEDMIVVQSKGAILVCPRSKNQEVRQIVDELKKKELKKYL